MSLLARLLGLLGLEQQQPSIADEQRRRRYATEDQQRQEWSQWTPDHAAALRRNSGG